MRRCGICGYKSSQPSAEQQSELKPSSSKDHRTLYTAPSDTMAASSKHALPSLPPPKQQHGLNSATFKQPPVDGSMLVPEMYDWHATHSPYHPLFTFSEDDGTVRTITWAEATPAIHRAGRWLLSLTVDTITEKKPLIAILAGSGASVSKG